MEEIGIECYRRELWRTKRHKDPPFETKGGAPGEGKINAEVAEETQSKSRSLALLGMTPCWNGRQDSGIEEGSFAALRMTVQKAGSG